MTDVDTTEEEVEVDDEIEEFDAAYYGIRVNGKIVWQSEGDPMLVDKVTINNARGEVTVIGSHNNDTWLDITVNVRTYEAPETYLDMIEAEKAQERRERFEPDTSGRTGDEEYVEADPETGKPIEDAEEKVATETDDLEF